jgi:hypothetical protein
MRTKYALLALVPICLVLQIGLAWGGGILKFDPEINWQLSPSLYIKVTGGPPNVCGDMYISTNGGAYSPLLNYLCTDSAGNATRGPWLWRDQAGDATTYAFVFWPNGQSTNGARHVWDKNPPTVTITSPLASPPASFYGTGADGPYGAGFSPSWGSYCVTQFYDMTTGQYWWPDSGYRGDSPYRGLNCGISGMPAHSVTWNETQLPPANAHLSGHCYAWLVFLRDAADTYTRQFGNAQINFCVP